MFVLFIESWLGTQIGKIFLLSCDQRFLRTALAPLLGLEEVNFLMCQQTGGLVTFDRSDPARFLPDYPADALPSQPRSHSCPGA